MTELPINIDVHSPGRLRVECCLCETTELVPSPTLATWTVVHFLEHHPAWRPAG